MRCAVLLGLSLVGCQSPTTVARCGEIPGGGCPVGRGGTCADQECAALYDCVDGSWKLAQVCELAGSGGGGAGGTGGSGAGGGCEGVVIEDPGGTGCTPDLQEP